MEKKSKYNDKKYNNKSSKFKNKNKINEPKSRSHVNDTNTDCDGVTNSPRINDASYYFASDLLKEQITKVSFNQFNGIPNELGTYVGQTNSQAQDKVPYAMAIELSPAAGYTGGSFSTVGNAINLAALNLYTTLSANNAKTSNYAPQDLTTLILGYGAIISMSSHITRLFGLAYLYNMRNRAFPASIIEAAGCDYDDLILNLAEYRVRFNNLMVAASKVPIPGNIPYFQKCSKLYSGVYWDMEGSDMAQTYLFTPGTTWLFSEEYSDQGTGLSTMPILDPAVRTEIPTMEFLLDMLDDMIGRLLNSATLNAIYSDVLRVSQKEGIPLYQLGSVSENYVVLPSYEPEIRRWINNATPMGYPMENPEEGFTPYNDVTPEVTFNRIGYKPQFKHTRSVAGLNLYVNFDSQNPTSDEIVESTRLAARATMKYIASGEYHTIDVALPDHYVNRIKIFAPDREPVIISEPVVNSLGIYGSISCFDWAPIMYVTQTANWVQSLGDLNYFTTLDYEYMSRLHDATYLGLLTIR